MNSNEKLNQRILIKIHKEQLKAFTAKDFIEMTNIKTINKNLERMEKNGIVRRITTGVYDIPDFSFVLNELTAPSITDVAYALARANNWKIYPSGSSALNYIGLSTQVPSGYTFVSSGPYKDYKIGNLTLTFKHTNNRLVFDSSLKTAILIQAIKKIGRNNITTNQKKIIKDFYTQTDTAKTILDESRSTTAWIYESIREIFEV